MKFYDVSTKTSVEVPENKIECVKTKNNRHLGVFKKDNKKLSRFLSKADAERIMKKNKKGKSKDE